MIVVNLTGLKRFYWIPYVERSSDGFGLWYASVRWLGVEVIAYSKEMATEFIQRLNASTKETV